MFGFGRKKTLPPAPPATVAPDADQHRGLPPIDDKDDPFKVNDRIRGFQNWLEGQSIIPVFIATLFALMLRSASTWNFGAWKVSDLPGPAVWIFNFFMGFAIAASMELIGTIAGRKWWLGRDKLMAVDEEFAEASAHVKKIIRHKDKDTGDVTEREVEDPKAVRARNLVAKKKTRQKNQNSMYLGFALFGNGASVYAALRYAFGSLDFSKPPATWDWGGLIQDVIISVIIVVVVFFIGVLYEPEAADEDQLAASGRKRFRYRMVKAAYTSLMTGDTDSRYVRYLMQGASGQERSELEAMLQVDRKTEIWSTAQIAEWLGWADTNKRREITRRISAAYKQGVEGVMHDPKKAKQWVVALPTVVQLFAEDFKASRNAATGRTLLGQVADTTQGGARAADGTIGQASDNGRTNAGATPVSNSDGSGTPSGPTVVDGTVTPVGGNDSDTGDDIERQIAELQAKILAIETRVRDALEDDVWQDLEALAKLTGLPLAHVQTMQREVLRDRRGLPAPREGDIIDAA